MYDRKTWIILAICGALIAANIHFSSVTKIEKAKAEQARAAEAAANAPAISAEETEPTGLKVETPPPPTSEELVILETEKVIFTFSNIGGGIKTAELKKQSMVGDKETKIRMNRHSAGPIGGLVDAEGKFANEKYNYKPEQSEAGKSVVFIAKLSSGLIAKKTYSLETSDIPGKPYFVNLELIVENAKSDVLNLSGYGIFLGTAAPLHEKEQAPKTGFFWNEAGKFKFEKAISFKDGWFSSEKFFINSSREQNVDYAGVTNQFFSTVIRPKTPALTRVQGRPKQVRLTEGGKVLSGVRATLALPPVSLAPNSQQVFNYAIFTGPKANTLLRKLDNTEGAGDGWGDVMQYGFFWFVSRPLNWLLNFLHNGIDNFSTTQSWGLAIICLTLIVRALIWPLHAKSTRSMKRMSKLQPKMKELKEKYPDDPTKLNTEMMGMYRKYGINPLGGCLPMLIQLPIFFGFFRMLDYAVELRNQPFLWVGDLSQPDTVGEIAGIPINLLPIVMAGTSFLQMALMPKTGDKMQQRIMMFMPLMFFFFCYNYASALALYWTTQNIFSIGQTYFMNKIPEPELKARKDGGKKSWVQRMAEKQAEMQKNQGKGKSKSSGNMRDVTPEKPKKKRAPRTGG